MLRQNVESFVACNMAAAIGEKVHRNCNILLGRASLFNLDCALITGSNF